MLRAAALNPFALGCVWVLGLYAIVASRPVVLPDDAILGKNAADISSLVVVHYAPELRRIGLELAFVSAGFGLLLGSSAAVLMVIRSLARAVPIRLVGWRPAALGLLVVVGLHAGCVAWWMTYYPQLYSKSFWLQGGLPRLIQVTVTDRVHPGGVVATGLAAFLFFILGLPHRWPRRGATILRRTWQARLFVAAVAAGGALFTSLARMPGRPACGSAGDKQPNIIILASDGLRADRLNGSVMPRIEALAERGTRFDRAYTAIPRTFPSWITLLTGLYPQHHGVRSDFPRVEQLAESFDALPRRLADAGYATAVVSDYAGDVFRRVDVGFQTTRAPQSGFVHLIRQKAIERVLPLVPVLQTHFGRRLLPDLQDMSLAADPALVADDAIATMRSIESKPFLLVVFFSTTHFPYAAPYPDYARFTNPSYSGPYRYENTVGLGSALEVSPDDARQIRALYDGAAHAVDTAAGRVLDAIVHDGIADRTLVVFTSDHGESLFEHAHGQGHGDHLFGDEGTHVPLMIYDPRAHAPHDERAVVSTVDLAPTVCELAGVPAPAPVDGRSLASAVRGTPIPSEFAFAESELWLVDNVAIPRDLRVPMPGIMRLLEVDTQHDDQIVTKVAAEPITLFARHRMVRDGRWKLLYMPTPLGVRYVLVDTREDPDELVDVSPSQPEELARMRAALWRWMLSAPGTRREGDYLVPTGTTLAELLAH